MNVRYRYLGDISYDPEYRPIRYLTLSPLYRPVPPSAAPPLTGRNRLHRSPLLPAETAWLAGLQNHAAWIEPLLAHIKRWRYFWWRCLWRSQIISAHVSCLHSRISGWFIQFLSSFSTSFFRVLTYFNGCVAAMDARLRFGTRLRCFCDRFVTVEFGENEHFAVALGSGSDVIRMSAMSTVIRVTLTALLLRCPRRQRFFDIS